jgi:hypothetical protein
LQPGRKGTKGKRKREQGKTFAPKGRTGTNGQSHAAARDHEAPAARQQQNLCRKPSLIRQQIERTAQRPSKGEISAEKASVFGSRFLMVSGGGMGLERGLTTEQTLIYFQNELFSLGERPFQALFQPSDALDF